MTAFRRLGGTEYPPNVFYKLYLSAGACGTRNITGCDVISSCDGARYGALANMGFVKYMAIALGDIAREDGGCGGREGDYGRVSGCGCYGDC